MIRLVAPILIVCMILLAGCTAAEVTGPSAPEPQSSCPFGMALDPAPGSCNRFIDADDSGFCDHSE
ncbi:hypothetical protein JW968_05625 [Candidatus Woesearchaeota archaeon]|nr:hypothetical protein [Candidatus Woesearchaeota archaeon]